ncbi:hypothetical protein C2G38_1313699 [Gigaspora rosea]|uniref:Uncharacterized protein n=1 Tax=Gigaspora rosea TaxID=44941 RepID=A0A397WB15_9GLOM|nr:hypothetical protein C2G38_1313699 [Gigaspora rosea]
MGIWFYMDHRICTNSDYTYTNPDLDPYYKYPCLSNATCANPVQFTYRASSLFIKLIATFLLLLLVIFIFIIITIINVDVFSSLSFMDFSTTNSFHLYIHYDFLYQHLLYLLPISLLLAQQFQPLLQLEKPIIHICYHYFNYFR